MAFNSAVHRFAPSVFGVVDIVTKDRDYSFAFAAYPLRPFTIP
jgi:hypothetical protein